MRENPPWLNDLLKSVASEYPDEERRHRHQGRGIIRLTVDLKTGVVTKATVIKRLDLGRLIAAPLPQPNAGRGSLGSGKKSTFPSYSI
jgi:hypothetical protein